MNRINTSQLPISFRLTNIKSLVTYSWLFAKDAFMILYVIAATVFVLFSIFELKYSFNIDLVPGVNFLFDDYYREIKNDLIR